VRFAAILVDAKGMVDGNGRGHGPIRFGEPSIQRDGVRGPYGPQIRDIGGVGNSFQELVEIRDDF